MSSNELTRVEFTFLQTGSLTVTVEIEPVDGETTEQTIDRARELVAQGGNPAADNLCAHCCGYSSEHRSAGGDGKYSLDFDPDLGKETEATILTENRA